MRKKPMINTMARMSRVKRETLICHESPFKNALKRVQGARRPSPGSQKPQMIQMISRTQRVTFRGVNRLLVKVRKAARVSGIAITNGTQRTCSESEAAPVSGKGARTHSFLKNAQTNTARA